MNKQMILTNEQRISLANTATATIKNCS